MRDIFTSINLPNGVRLQKQLRLPSSLRQGEGIYVGDYFGCVGMLYYDINWARWEATLHIDDENAKEIEACLKDEGWRRDHTTSD